MTDINLVISHFEFFGYEMELDGDTYAASNPYKFDFLVEEYKGSIIFRLDILTNLYAKANRGQLLEFVNTANRIMDVASATVDSGTDVEFAAFYVGPYEKVIFGRLLELWNKDFNDFTKDHEFPQFFNPVA